MDVIALQIDDLRELRQAWTEWLESVLERERWCREDTLEWHPERSRSGVIEIDLVD